VQWLFLKNHREKEDREEDTGALCLFSSDYKCGRAHATSASPPLCVRIIFVTLLGSCSFHYREHRLPPKQLIEYFGNSVKFCNSVAMGTGPRKAGFDVNDGGPDAPLSPL
jgi:hypothetical protein